MAKLIIKLEEEDIITNWIGCNIQITTKANIDVIFTPEALRELILDYGVLLEDKFQNQQSEQNG